MLTSTGLNVIRAPITLITGAKGGLGTAVTNAFLAAGHTVAGVSRSIQAADFPHPNFVPLPAELSTATEAQHAVDSVRERFGRLDNLIHLVGTWAGGKPVAETPDEMLQSLWQTNVISTFQILRAAIPALRASGHGRIVAAGSRSAVDPTPGSGAYNAAKSAMVALVKTVALEEAQHGITANVVLPGTMDTPANRKAMPNADFSRWAPTESVASLILWLTSEAARSVNGAALPIYGRD
ncbi:MAG: SDR family NAD(P)-dependent oxidoreductase [Bryobacterales bacterium]|nr:SDR family NAD(P)-dependent oxidoreductase [Bryobacterales bacterium]